ncbi:DUF2851 family protein [Galbibacter sp. EGI 63066]|uniref:DUF2851 family protein n=1 Tax=Galbibacter sp. EGI 63066 TaxID=2993559 RepID=UPI00224980A4|nr:DUF2851 family protein [Galbibacter sp. EGI 63066]MCX2679704.1 DUF2851 family protein [Galbibacter sp. EGI 63066]
MKEDFLHYIWKFKKLPTSQLSTEEGENITLISIGTHNRNAGPDFLNAQLRIGEQHWAGNVEIHLKSSDWYLHNHEKDPAYNNVILHVVWEHDVEVFNQSNVAIPTLVLKDRVKEETLTTYQQFLHQKTGFINCEKSINTIDEFLRKRWLERLFFERLASKSAFIDQELEDATQDWEAVLFKMLMKNFGLKVNADAFHDIACHLPFSVVRKNKDNLFALEALLFGVSGLLEGESVDTYFTTLKKEYTYLKKKYQLTNSSVAVQFFKLRPSNFPTIRLSQIAALYHKESSLFQQLMQAKSPAALYELFQVSASTYWDTHYTFDKESKTQRKKKLTRNFIDLLIVNTVVPLKFCYAKSKGEDANEALLKLIEGVKKEENTIISSFENTGLLPSSALESQGLLQLYNNYCTKNKCLQCEIGVKLMG